MVCSRLQPIMIKPYNPSKGHPGKRNNFDPLPSSPISTQKTFLGPTITPDSILWVRYPIKIIALHLVFPPILACSAGDHPIFAHPKLTKCTHTHIYIYKGTSSGKYYLHHQWYGVYIYIIMCVYVFVLYISICVIYCKFPAFFLVKPSYDCTVDLRSGSKVRPRQPNGPEALNLVCVSCDVNKILDASSWQLNSHRWSMNLWNRWISRCHVCLRVYRRQIRRQMKISMSSPWVPIANQGFVLLYLWRWRIKLM